MQTDSRKRTRCFYLLTLITIIVALIGCSSGGSGNGTDQAPLSLEIRGNDWLITNGDSTPSQIDGTEFGPTPENGSETHTFTLYNKAAVAISINSIELTGDAHFSTDTSALTLKPGDESDITVVFTPAGATRNAEATITLETSGASYTFALLGTTRAIWGETAWWVATEKDQETWGRIYFDPDAVVRSNATEQDLKEIAEVAAGVRRDFALMDNDAYSKRVDPDILRFTSEEKYTVGAAEAMEAIEWEWIGRERPVEPVIAVSETFNDFELWVDGDGAVASYVLDQVYGARWIEHGRYRIFQAFSKGDDGWKLAVQHDAGDLTEIEEGTSVLFFDWAYPVKDLERATAWYENFFGEPQVSTSSRTTWNLDMANFHLDTTDLAGHVNIIEGMPNGYAIIYTTNDIEAEHDRLEALGVDISTEVLTDWGPDPYFVAMDPVGNPFVWMQRVGQNDPTGDAPGLTIENPGNIPDDLFAEIEALFTDWVSADAQSVGERMPENGIWCDAYGFAWGRGPDEAQTALTAMFTDKSNGRVFDTTPNGLDLDIVATSMNLRNIGSFTIITLDLDITWRGAHNFHELASAALTYRQNGEEWGLVHVFISPGAFPGEMVWSLDYTGYPISRGNLDAAEDFYTNTLSFGTPYTDFAYFGYWSADSVFGIYQTGPGRDGMPRPGETSGYASFWVGSAQEAFDKLESLGADFPIIWAINGVSGIEYVPGYTQLYTVDSEGNGMLFSEYPGD